MLTNTMRKHYIFKLKAFISPYTLMIFMIYLSLITFYTTQFGLKLKTIQNINNYYDRTIIEKFEKGD